MIFGIGFFVRVLRWVGIALLIIWIIAHIASRMLSR